MPNIDKLSKDYEDNLTSQILKFSRQIESIYFTSIDEISLYSKALKQLNFELSPALKKKMEKVLRGMQRKIEASITNSVEQAWAMANDKNDTIADQVIGDTTLTKKAENLIYNPNAAALTEFFSRVEDGLNLSDRVWNFVEPYRHELEAGLAYGIGNGQSASQMAGDLKRYLKEPDKLFRRVRDADGKLQLSRAAAMYNPGTGVYRSSYQNAIRLTGTETNIAYRSSDFERWNNMSFVIGIEIKLSPRHLRECSLTGGKACDICDDFTGQYPKDFKFTGWHPRCYSNDTEVLTNNGWKLFENLKKSDEIFSLNSDTKQVKYVGFKNYIKYHYEGEMVRFYNRSLDMFVTPNHPMKYLNKTNNKTFDESEARDYQSTKGALYRSSQYKGEEIEFIKIGNHKLQFDLFAEFMAYYLAEGSLSWTRKNQMQIAQSKATHKKQYETIEKCLEKTPFKFTAGANGFYLRDKYLYEYLKQFGKSPQKNIPFEIKNSCKRQIEIFLNAYVICDGYTKKKKEFIGNRGSRFTPNNNERIFYSSSVKMIADIGEILVKIGKRPSYKIDALKGTSQKHKNGIYKCNEDNWKISECHSETATVFKKEVVNYSGFVYDIELNENSIFYVRRNGKCVWGSNCRCYSIPKLATQKQFDAMEDKLLGLGDKDPDIKYVQNIPGKAQNWIRDNRDRIAGWKNEPYWIADNPSYTTPLMQPQLVGETQKDYAKRVIDKLPLPGKLAEDPDLYFLPENGTKRVKISDIISAKSADQTITSGQNAARRLWAASKGMLSKRDPISVENLGNGKYKVLDGNSTLAAAKLNNWDEILVDDNPVRGLMVKSKESAGEIKAMGDEFLAKFGGTVTPVNLKSAKSINKKVENDIAGKDVKILGDIQKIVKDGVRLTNIVPYDLLQEIIDTISVDRRFTAAGGGRVKVQAGPDYYGYKGVLTNVLTANGLTAEVQFNSPGMMYAKDIESVVRPLIGDKIYDEIHARTGLVGGKGHEYFDELKNFKTLEVNGTITAEQIKERDLLIDKSVKYYANFYGF